jgi:hypothetical protein
MPEPTSTIQFPTTFRLDHEQAVIAYLSNELSGKESWTLAFEAFDILDQASIIHYQERITFRSLYQKMVDHQFADSYIDDLLLLENVEKQSPALWAQYARQIVNNIIGDGLIQSDKPETRLLLSYLLYWWNAFARGYAFEVEIYRDLQQSNIQFQAHDLRDRQQRYSPGDLTVSNMMGDIKTSTYFVQTIITPLAHDFYIVRLLVQNRVRTLVAFLQTSTWKKINGDTIEATLETAANHLPTPVKIQHRGHELVILDYNTWKQRIRRYQGGNL